MTDPHLSFTGRRWSIHNSDGLLGASLLDALRRARGLDTTAIDTFGAPDLLPDAALAAERIRAAIAQHETVGIVGDYDCDGITAVAQLIRLFRRYDLEPIVRLPHRVHDGYGLSARMVEDMHAQHVTLMITADTGVSAIAEVALAKQCGMDVIVTDHHMLTDALPDALAIVHPGRSALYPLPHPSGAGVVYHLLRMVEGASWQGHEEDAVLATIGTVADLVPLTGYNRLLVQQGLRHFGALRNSPLLALAEIAGIDPLTITSTDIAFRLAPRINASGRMASPDLALQALLGDTDAITTLDTLNRDRQTETEEHFAQALKEIEATPTTPPLLSSLSTTYSHGIIGLIAGRLTERIGRPSMVAVQEGDMCTASLRSTPAYHIAEGLDRHKHLLLRYGGHAQAAGCTLLREHWEALCMGLHADIAERTTPDMLVPTTEIDAMLPTDVITTTFIAALDTLEPHGQGNREPLFLIRNVRIDDARQVGKERLHLQGKVQGRKLIGFHRGGLLPYCTEPMDIVCRLGMDEWQGIRQPQLYLVDARATKNAAVAAHVKALDAIAYTGARLPSIANTSVIGTSNAAEIL
jgi:single-stranded-DNA-specific exonuclease